MGTDAAKPRVARRRGVCVDRCNTHRLRDESRRCRTGRLDGTGHPNRRGVAPLGDGAVRYRLGPERVTAGPFQHDTSRRNSAKYPCANHHCGVNHRGQDSEMGTSTAVASANGASTQKGRMLLDMSSDGSVIRARPGRLQRIETNPH